MLHRRGVELRADALEHFVALGALIAEHAHLDQFVRQQTDVDFMQHGRCEARVADCDHRRKSVRFGAQRTALGRRDGFHECILQGVRRYSANKEIKEIKE